MTKRLLHRARAGLRRRHDLRRKWTHLSFNQRRTFLTFVALVPTMRLGLRTLGFNRMYRGLERLSSDSTRRAFPASTRPELMLALRRARRYAPYRGNCLSQSLTLWWLLRRRGCTAELCLGARLDDGRLSAHAWVESEGIVINDTATVRQRFTAFAPIADMRASSWS